jgi:cyclopropane fatty-acyl-phospholipid synthase-like methyltransferase
VDEVDIGAIVRDGYDQIAEHYMTAVARPRADEQRDAWTARLSKLLAPKSAVLDLGCGSAVPSTAALASAGHRVVGVDISRRQIELARHNVPAATFVACDATDFTAEPGSFDAVMALYSLTHVPRDRYPMLFARIVEWLRPGGWLLASMGTSDQAGWNEENFLGFGHASWTNGCDPTTSRTLLERAGFELERAEIIEYETPFGDERWFWVLGRRAAGA